MKERYNIEIAGIQLTILSDEPKEFVESSVAHLDETIRTMTVKNKRCSKLDAAVLCALDFYSEKTKADKKSKKSGSADSPVRSKYPPPERGSGAASCRIRSRRKSGRKARSRRKACPDYPPYRPDRHSRHPNGARGKEC